MAVKKNPLDLSGNGNEEEPVDEDAVTIVH
jgi:hypothetical protein